VLSYSSTSISLLTLVETATSKRKVSLSLSVEENLRPSPAGCRDPFRWTRRSAGEDGRRAGACEEGAAAEQCRRRLLLPSSVSCCSPRVLSRDSSRESRCVGKLSLAFLLFFLRIKALAFRPHAEKKRNEERRRATEAKRVRFFNLDVFFFFLSLLSKKETTFFPLSLSQTPVT